MRHNFVVFYNIRLSLVKVAPRRFDHISLIFSRAITAKSRSSTRKNKLLQNKAHLPFSLIPVYIIPIPKSTLNKMAKSVAL